MLARTLIAEGRFQDCTLPGLLESLATSRQPLELELDRSDRLQGKLVVKSGQLLQASEGAQRGHAALYALLHEPADTFRLYRLPDHAGLPSLGALPDLLRSTGATSLSSWGQAGGAAGAASAAAGQLMLETSLGVMRLADLMRVTSSSRQILRILFQDPRGELGGMVTKSGQLLEAWSTPLARPGTPQAGRAAFEILARLQDASVKVYRLSAARSTPPIGSLLGMLDALSAVAPTAPAPPEEILLEGPLDADQPLASLLGMLSLSRQVLEIRLSEEGGRRPRGALLLKAGMVLAAESTDHPQDPLAALDSLRAAPGSHYQVVRSTRSFSRPLSSLEALLAGPAARPAAAGSAPAPAAAAAPVAEVSRMEQVIAALTSSLQAISQQQQHQQAAPAPTSAATEGVDADELRAVLVEVRSELDQQAVVLQALRQQLAAGEMLGTDTSSRILLVAVLALQVLLLVGLLLPYLPG